VVAVPDRRLAALAEIVKPARIIPATVEFVDIAGLVAGAALGEGLGNRFLAHIRETHALIHLVRCFDDENVTHMAGKIDPVADIAVINTELALADLATVEKALQRYAKAASAGGDKAAQRLVAVLEKAQAVLDEARPVRSLDLCPEEWAVLKPLCLLTAKPVMYVANVKEDGFNGNPHLAAAQQYAHHEKALLVPVCAATEADSGALPEQDRAALLTLNGVIRAAFKILGLQTFFTAGAKEVRAWTVSIGATARQAAGVIHTDFARGFIRAEVIAYDDFIACKGEQGAKRTGKMRLEGKEYIVRDGDLMHFRFNV
jgi:ribosome-binding ATPase